MPARILYIHYYSPPIQTVAAIRLSNFVNASAPHFEKVYVISTSHYLLYQQEELPLKEHHSISIPSYDLRWWLSKIGKKEVTVFSSFKKRRRVNVFLLKLLDSFPLNILIGDGGLIYILKAYKQARKLIQEEGISHISSSFRPYSDHIVAYLLKEKYPQLVWIADFRDVHVDPNRKNVIWPSLQHAVNKWFLKKADVITTVSKGLGKYLRRYHENVFVLRNGFSDQIHQIQEAKSLDFFTISYTGSFYPKFQDIHPLFKALKYLVDHGQIEASKVKFVVAGRDKAAWQTIATSDAFSMELDYKGQVNREEAVALQQMSNINLILSWSSSDLSGILTAKFYDYVAAEVPILVSVNGIKDEEFEEIFTQYPLGKVVCEGEHQIEEIQTFILQEYQYWQKTGKQRLVEVDRTSFSWEYQFDEFIKYLFNQHSS